MKGVLSDKALDELNENGFARTGIYLPAPLLTNIRETYEGLPASGSNWGFFELNSLANSGARSWRKLPRRIARKLAPWLVHLHIRRNVYSKSIYGSSEVLPLFLQECMYQGLADYLGNIPLLVGHDIYLEHDRDHATFGCHNDGFGWSIFFQTDDDLSFYVALQDLTESSGGRLLVERHPKRSVLYEDRNQAICEFAAYCRKHHATNHSGLVTREAVEQSPNRQDIADEFGRLFGRRAALRPPGRADMNPIDAIEGEVVLFNNKYFHDIEPWNRDTHRSVYIVRCFPFYDLGLAPPVSFLNRVPCNRFVIHGVQGAFNPIDCENEQLLFVALPS